MDGKIKEKYGLWVGMWHPTSGYWSGINPNGALAKKHGENRFYHFSTFSLLLGSSILETVIA